MSTADQTLSAALHGEALLAAQDEALTPVIEQLAAATAELGSARVEAAGLLAGEWFASPNPGRGRDLLVVGLLLLAGPVDGDHLVKSIRAGLARGPAERSPSATRRASSEA